MTSERYSLSLFVSLDPCPDLGHTKSAGKALCLLKRLPVQGKHSVSGECSNYDGKGAQEGGEIEKGLPNPKPGA